MALLEPITTITYRPLVVWLAAVALLMGCATDSAVAQSHTFTGDDEVELTFSRIEVDDRSRRLEVEYRLENEGWRWARDNEYDLWLTVYAPSDDDYVFVHGMPLQTARGRVLFPSHVRYYNYPYVGLCVVAVGVGEELEPGYGYVCDNPIRVNVQQSRDVYWSDTRVIFSLGFHSGLYHYPWFHPYYGFYYPSYYYGPYPPTVIYRDRYRGYYYPRHYRRDKHDKYDEYDRDGRDGYDRRRYDRETPAQPERRRFEPTQPKTTEGKPNQRDLKFRSVEKGTPSERKRLEPTRPTPQPQRIEPDRIDPTPQRIRPQPQPQRVQPPRQRFEPTPRPQQIRPQQIRPQQIRPQPQRIQPPRQRFEPTPRPQQIRPQQIRPQQIRPQQIRPQPQRIQPPRQRLQSAPRPGK